VEEMYARVHDGLTRNRAALDALAEALLERETIEGAEALIIFHTHGVVPVELSRRRSVDSGIRGTRRFPQGSA